MFVVTTVGGLVGVLLPHLEFTSPFEMLLPHGLRSNSLVKSIVHPEVADIQNVLGRPEARPKAPFPFANSWGSSLSLYLPFFIVAWFRYGPRWQRYAAPVVLLVALVPIVYSLNRGLWASLALGVVGAVILVLRTGRLVPVLTAVALLVAVVVGFVISPLDTIFQERLAHQHSNERRGELISRTVSSAFEGSPVVGFGSTRDVQGGFSSIASADTPDCEACGVPPLGTQGHLWGVIFGQGFVGAIFFVAFFLQALWRSWRCRTTSEILCTFVLAFFCLQIFIYDTLGMPLLTVMIAIGLVAREQFLGADSATDVRGLGARACLRAVPRRPDAPRRRRGRVHGLPVAGGLRHPGVDPAGAAAGLPVHDRSDGRGQPAGRRHHRHRGGAVDLAPVAEPGPRHAGHRGPERAARASADHRRAEHERAHDRGPRR